MALMYEAQQTPFLWRNNEIRNKFYVIYKTSIMYFQLHAAYRY